MQTTGGVIPGESARNAAGAVIASEAGTCQIRVIPVRTNVIDPSDDAFAGQPYASRNCA